MRKVLILGGTAWLGRAIARRAADEGAAVTCLARGQSGVAAAGVRLERCDRSRPGAYETVRHQRWDEVIELSYDRAFVSESLAAIGDNARHWTLISSVSVYAQNDEPGADESAELAKPIDHTEHDQTVQDGTDPDYSRAKVTAEEIMNAAVGDRLLIVRPGLIAGAGDTSDRFGYWVARFASESARERPGPVLVPETVGRSVQIIDVLDVAAWVVEAGLRSTTGRFNTVGTVYPFEDVLAAAASAAGFAGQLVTAHDDWLVSHHVNYWAGPRSLPLWLPAADCGFMHRDNVQFIAAGGTLSTLSDTLARVLVDERERGLDRDRLAGLSRADELSLLATLATGE